MIKRIVLIILILNAISVAAQNPESAYLVKIHDATQTHLDTMSDAIQGQLAYNTDSSTLMFFDGNVWVSVKDSSSSEWEDAKNINGDEYVYLKQAFDNGDTVVFTDKGQLIIGDTIAANPTLVHITRPEGENAGVQYSTINPGTGTAKYALLTTQTDSSTMYVGSHGPGRTLVRLGHTVAGWNEIVGINGKGIALGTKNSAPVQIGTNDSVRMHVDAGGNIGIKTEEPTVDLDVNGYVRIRKADTSQFATDTVLTVDSAGVIHKMSISGLGGGLIDSIRAENDTLYVYEGDTVHKTYLPKTFTINGLDNSTVYYVNSDTAGGSGSTSTAKPIVTKFIEDHHNYGFYGQAFIMSDNSIWSTGRGTEYTWGVSGTTIHAYKPTRVIVDNTDPPKGKWKYIFGTYSALYALTDSGELYARGHAHYGQLGNGTTTTHNTILKRIDYFETNNIFVNYLYVPNYFYGSGYNCLMALDNNGDVYSWGYNGYGQLGHGNTTQLTTPQKIAALDVPYIAKMSISANRYSSVYAIDTDNRLWAWGRNNRGQLGLGNTTQYTTPQQLPASIRATEVVAKSYNTASHGARIITTTNNTMAAGSNLDGQIGDGTATQRTSFTLPDTTFTNVAEVTSNAGSGNNNGINALVTYDGELFFSGLNTYRQQGIGTSTADQRSFVKPSGDFQGMVKKVRFASYGTFSRVIVLDTLGRIWTCGYNNYGALAQLGTHTTDPDGLFNLAYDELSGSEKFIDFRVFGYQNNAGFSVLTETGKVLSVGRNTNGTVGINSTTTGNTQYFLKRINFD